MNKGIISLICSQSQILKKNVYLIETMEKASTEKLLHLSVIYFIRPTEDNLYKLANEIKNPRFREYNICMRLIMMELYVNEYSFQ